MIDLARGNGFAAQGVRITGYDKDGVAVRIGPTYGPDVELQPLYRQWGSTADGAFGRLTLASDARAGVTPTARLESPSGAAGRVTVIGTDRRGRIEYTAGTGAVAGTQFTVLFTRPYRATPIISLTPIRQYLPSSTAMLQWPSDKSFQISFTSPPVMDATYAFYYSVDEVWS